MSKLIIVCGQPGSGKTTLARELSQRLNIVCLHKDEIIEHLFDRLDGQTEEESVKISNAGMMLLFDLAKNIVSRNVDLIVEAPFRLPDKWEQFFRHWEQEFGTKIFSVICEIDRDEQMKRVTNRPRHRVFQFGDRKVAAGTHASLQADYDGIPGKQLRLMTDKPIGELVDQVIAHLA